MGFTFIELMVVIAIISIVSTLSFTALSSAQAKARDAKRIHNLRLLYDALVMYELDYGNYPLIYANHGVSDFVVADSANASVGMYGSNNNSDRYYWQQASAPSEPTLGGDLASYSGSLPEDPLNRIGPDGFYYAYGYVGFVDPTTGTPLTKYYHLVGSCSYTYSVVPPGIPCRGYLTARLEKTEPNSTAYKYIKEQCGGGTPPPYQILLLP